MIGMPSRVAAEVWLRITTSGYRGTEYYGALALEIQLIAITDTRRQKPGEELGRRRGVALHPRPTSSQGRIAQNQQFIGESVPGGEEGGGGVFVNDLRGSNAPCTNDAHRLALQQVAHEQVGEPPLVLPRPHEAVPLHHPPGRRKRQRRRQLSGGLCQYPWKETPASKVSTCLPERV